MLLGWDQENSEFFKWTQMRKHIGDSWDHVTPGKEDRFTWVDKTPTGEWGQAGHQEIWGREGRHRSKGLFPVTGVSLNDPEGPSRGPVHPSSQETLSVLIICQIQTSLSVLKRSSEQWGSYAPHHQPLPVIQLDPGRTKQQWRGQRWLRNSLILPDSLFFPPCNFSHWGPEI